jgi:predicted alpha/beta-hydrolase family hydrolase
MTRLGPIFQLDGDSCTGPTRIEIALQQRLARHATGWTGQWDMIRAAGATQQDRNIPRRLAQLERAVADAKDAILIGRSSGARVATLFAARRPVRAVICLAYPFQNPGKAEEPARYAHLARLGTPTLMLQGVADAYGGREILARYAFSPAITVEFIEADHAFRLSAAQWDAAAARILRFCAEERPG